MTAEILSVGTELLLGNIVDSNAAFLSRELAAVGVAVYRRSTVGDNKARLLQAFEAAFAGADMVVASGGLGPTLDDITKVAAAEFFGRQLVVHEESLARIKARFTGRELPENVQRNALVPEGAATLPNDFGSAPGIVLEEKGKILMMLPGPPHEMMPMFQQYAVPFLQKRSNQVFLSQTLKLIGIGETKAETLLQDLIETQTNPTIAPYAKLGEVHIRLTAAAANSSAAQAILDPLAKELYRRIGENIYAEGETTLPETVIALLQSKNQTLAVAESCTGGKITSHLVAVAGASSTLMQGLVTYSNQAKISRLNVPENLLNSHGAVSHQVAAAMAEGARKTSNTTVGLSTTGIAGPGGGTPAKPVGLVYVAISIKGQPTITHKFNLPGTREEIRTRAAKLALNALRRELI
ncbi:MAG: competence/damage-inducible protein A [Defluviitaleaceae bacterium]|nr:competence/damage-inducible protein A [Defluviitaleaceae bacterium]